MKTVVKQDWQRRLRRIAPIVERHRGDPEKPLQPVTDRIDLRHIRVSFYKKGTTHIEFRDPNLLNELNVFACQQKGWLPPDYSETAYEDLTPATRAVWQIPSTAKRRIAKSASASAATPPSPTACNPCPCSHCRNRANHPKNCPMIRPKIYPKNGKHMRRI